MGQALCPHHLKNTKLTLENLASERARLIEQGVPMGQLKGNADALWFCDGQDPDGNCLQISNRA